MSGTYSFPVFETQNGGLVRADNDNFIFIEEPNCHGLGIGDEMPIEWRITPANEAAQSIVNNSCCVANCGCVEHAEAGIACRHDILAACKTLTS